MEKPQRAAARLLLLMATDGVVAPVLRGRPGENSHQFSMHKVKATNVDLCHHMCHVTKVKPFLIGISLCEWHEYYAYRVMGKNNVSESWSVVNPNSIHSNPFQ